MTATRKETDSLGAVDVPAGALFGAQTMRAVENFPISGTRLPPEFLSALGILKATAATVNYRAGRLDAQAAQAIISAAGEVATNRLDNHFPVDVFQTGSGTSTNMNANEVIANRAIQLLGGELGDPDLDASKRIHPNDQVNMGQSSNDVIPTALHVSAALAIHRELLGALSLLSGALRDKAAEFDDVVKIGRTHLMDAVPIRLGQEFSGYAAQVDASAERIKQALDRLCELAVGGTAVGTGLNAPEGFAAAVCGILADSLHLPFREASNHFAASGARDAALGASAAIRSSAVALGKIASDIRLLGSGPRCGLGELLLPAVQPGSSIMPGKVNPVICEAVIQVTCQVIGNDAAVTAGAMGGVGSILELNLAMPMIAANLLGSIRLLTNAARVFTTRCIGGLRADAGRCHDLVEQSLAMVTALAPEIGYDAAAELAKRAYREGKTIRDLCREENVLSEDELATRLDARRQTGN